MFLMALYFQAVSEPTYSTSAVAKFYLLLHTKPKAVEMGCFAISNDSDFAVWLLLFFLSCFFIFFIVVRRAARCFNSWL